MRLLLLFTLCGIIRSNSIGQDYFNRNYDFRLNDAATGILYQNDSIILKTYESDTNEFGFSLVPIQPNGDTLKRKSFLFSDQYLYNGWYGDFTSINNRFLIAGTLQIADSYALNIYYCGLSDDTMVAKTALSEIYLGVYGTSKINDTQYYFCGGIDTFALNPDILIGKADIYGNILWMKQYGDPDKRDYARNVITLSNGTALVTCVKQEEKFPSGLFDYSLYILNVDSSGMMLWDLTINHKWGDYGSAPIPVNNAFYGIYSRDVFGGFIPFNVPYLYKMSNAGHLEFLNPIEDNDEISDTSVVSKFAFSFLMLSDGNMLIVGTAQDTSTTSLTGIGWLCKIDTTGKKIWERYYRHTEDVSNYLLDAVELPNGDIAACGWVNLPAPNYMDAWLIKVDKYGCLEPGCQLADSLPLNPILADSSIIYPTLSNNQFWVELYFKDQQPRTHYLELFDIGGKLIYSSRKNEISVLNNRGYTKFYADLRPLAQGIYIYKLTIGDSKPITGKVLRY